MVKNIEITNESEYRQFLRKLPLYKSLLFRFAEFRVNSAVFPETVREIAEALNMKRRRERIRYIYDRACEYVDRYNAENGIFCAFSDGMCEDPKHQRLKNGCCYICHLVTAEGCPTRNLACKLFYCDHMAAKYGDRLLTADRIDLLRLLSPSQRLIARENVYVTRQTQLRQLYHGSYLIYCMYSVIKPFRFQNFWRRQTAR